MTGSSLTEDEVRRVFSPLETRGGSAEFLKHVSEDVDWTIKGTHPLACHYFSRKEFQDVLARLGAGLREPIKMKVTSNLTCGDWAVIEMFANGCVAKAGWTFDNNYCWVCRFDKGIIVEARAYPDSAMVARLVKESEG